jgi:hypothetical protein
LKNAKSIVLSKVKNKPIFYLKLKLISNHEENIDEILRILRYI